MTALIPYSEPPIPRVALEIERIRQRLDAAEAQLKAQHSQPVLRSAGAPVGWLLPAVSTVATVALVVIAGTMVWQQTHAIPPAQPTIVVQVPPPSVQATQPTVQANAQAPAFRPPIFLPPPVRPGTRW